MRKLILVLLVFVLVGCTPKTESSEKEGSNGASSKPTSNKNTDSENDSKKNPEPDNSVAAPKKMKEDYPIEIPITQNESDDFLKEFKPGGIMYRFKNSDKRVNTAFKKETFNQTKQSFIKENIAWEEKYNFLINKKYDIAALNFMPISERTDKEYNDFGVHKLSGVHYEKYENLLFETIEWLQKTNDELDDVLKVKDFVCASQKEKVDCSQRYIFPIKNDDNVPSLLKRN